METTSSVRNETIDIYFSPTDKIDSTANTQKERLWHNVGVFFSLVSVAFFFIGFALVRATVYSWVDIMLSPYIFIHSKARIS